MRCGQQQGAVPAAGSGSGGSQCQGGEGVSGGAYMPLFCLFLPSCLLNGYVAFMGLKMTPSTAAGAGSLPCPHPLR